MLEISPLATSPGAALELAGQYAPYLKRLQDRFKPLPSLSACQAAYSDSLQRCLDEQTIQTDILRSLRYAKSQAHLAIAGLDLSGQDTCRDTTQRISCFADHACQAALSHVLNQQGLPASGLFLVALGKMGAHELNYSSDIDLAAFLDTDLFEAPAGEVTALASRLVRDAMHILSQQTGEGYVFRTDLRLRPDPGSTPLAVPTKRALLYYESVGQNWERMAWIKGRACAGDKQAAEDFLNALQPFIWRQHLDYWAIADVEAIKNMIGSKLGETGAQNVSPDIKLGTGGIREIEFFAQTQQIILGGRNAQLRRPGTLEALDALAELGAISRSVATGLHQAYEQYRKLEHRLQMVEDQQTHTVPAEASKRAAIARLCGYEELARFDKDLRDTRQWVNAQYRKLFEKPSGSKPAFEGNLVFTGVDDDPGTVDTLSTLGFRQPVAVIARIRRWHRGHAQATRNRRGRELLTALLPEILRQISLMGDPDMAFARFSRFFEGLRSGVQTLSMLQAEPALLEDLIATLALAPRIADTLAKRPHLLESLLTVSDRELRFELSQEQDFETAMNAMRRWHAAESFLLGHRLLQGQIKAQHAARSWSVLADTAIQAMAAAAHRETERKFGSQPGKWVVAGLGKLGGEDMTAGSDLDILLVYDAPGAQEAQSWYTRFTQRLITALSAETAEGALYEVDMRLRPSGRQGPVATSFSAFRRYHAETAWTWEHMALTRLRPVAGDTQLGASLVQTAQSVRGIRMPEQITQDVLEMRQRLYRDKPGRGRWDLKLRPGGLLDIEFILQHQLLLSPMVRHTARLSEGFEALKEAGQLTDEACHLLQSAYRILQSLQQVQRLAFEQIMPRDEISPGLADRLCRAVSVSDFASLEALIEIQCQRVSDLFCKIIGNPATNS